MLSVRLDEATEQRLSEVCRQLGRTKSEVVKESLAEWLERFNPPPRAYELGEDLFDQGECARPPKDPHHHQLWDYLDAKYRTR